MDPARATVEQLQARVSELEEELAGARARIAELEEELAGAREPVHTAAAPKQPADAPKGVAGFGPRATPDDSC
jgi:phage shock protein A